MKTFYLFRHALATHSTTGYGDKILTAEILPEGIPPIERMTQFLKTIPSDFNASSEILRCRQTVEIIAQITGKYFVFDKRLNEYWPESKESFSDFCARAKAFVNDMKSCTYQSILVCTHGVVIAAIKHFLLDGNFDSSQILDYPLPGTMAIIKNGSFEVIDFN